MFYALNVAILTFFLLAAPQHSFANAEAIRTFKAACAHDQSAANLLQYLYALAKFKRELPDLIKSRSVIPTLQAMAARHAVAERNVDLKKHMQQVTGDYITLCENVKSHLIFDDALETHENETITPLIKKYSLLARNDFIKAEEQRTDKHWNPEIGLFATYAKAMIDGEGSFVSETYKNNKPTFTDPHEDPDYIFPAVYAEFDLSIDENLNTLDHSLAFLWYARAAHGGSLHATIQVALRLKCGGNCFQDIEHGESILQYLFPIENQLPQEFTHFLKGKMGTVWAYRTAMFSLLLGVDLFMNKTPHEYVRDCFFIMIATILTEKIFTHPIPLSENSLQRIIRNDLDLATFMATLNPPRHATDCCKILNAVSTKHYNYLYPTRATPRNIITIYLSPVD